MHKNRRWQKESILDWGVNSVGQVDPWYQKNKTSELVLKPSYLFDTILLNPAIKTQMIFKVNFNVHFKI